MHYSVVRFQSLFAATLIAAGLLPSLVVAQQLKEPVYRVAKDDKQVTATAAKADDNWFDFSKREGEHPLAPAKRHAEKTLKYIDENISDYSCLFMKRERIEGELSDVNYIQMEAKHKPFAVHMKFIKPKKDQECLFVKGANDDKLLARGSGWKSWAGIQTLDPTGATAMTDNRHPITRAGFRNLTNLMIQRCEKEMKYGECNVNVHEKVVDKRPCVMIEVIHPVKRKEFDYHITQTYLDKEFRVPVRFHSYTWPTEKDGKPVLEEQYVYTRLKLNTDLKASYFTQENHFK